MMPPIFQIAEKAQEHLVNDGGIAPVALLELPDGQAVYPLKYNSRDSLMQQCIIVGATAKHVKATRVFMVSDTFLKELQEGDPDPPEDFNPSDMPLDDQRHAINVMEVNFIEPAKSRILVQEYRILGRTEPEFLKPMIMEDSENEVCVTLLMAYFKGLPPGVKVELKDFEEFGEDSNAD